MPLRHLPTLICLFCFGILSVQAQDTTVVQTLTYDSTGRNYVFTFPDQPINSYEKILMRYSMRCKNKLVSNGSNPNLGCGEWDYSCNTFITDPTRLDSIFSTHPSHLISNFSGTTLNYSDDPTYTYYSYDQQQVTYASTISESVAEVGSGSDTYELGGAEKTGKVQLLYTANELSAAGVNAGEITSIRLDVSQLGSDLSFLRVRMKATNQSELDENQVELDGFTEVYFQNTAFPTSDWQGLLFYQPFDWDGSSNVLVELSYTGTNTDSKVGFNSHSTAAPQMLQSAASDYVLEFTGAGGATIPVDGYDAISNEVTVMLWTRGNPDVLPVNTYLLEAQDAAGNRQLNVHHPWGNEQIYWDCGNDGSGYDRINKVATPAEYEGNWNHWAFTKNATTGQMNIFLNGQLWHTGNGHTRPIDIQRFALGSNGGRNAFYYGQLDELSIWNKALDQATIADYVRKSIDSNHPDYDHLVAYYPFNEGQGNDVQDVSVQNAMADLDAAAQWIQQRGVNHFKQFEATTDRLNVAFVQGEYQTTIATVAVLDSVQNTPHRIITFDVSGTDLVSVDTSFVYPAGDMSILDENGMEIGTITTAVDGNVDISTLEYFRKFEAKFEILSLVTPYGINLDLGDGKTFTFDVTDYAPILRGDRRMSIELGGQFQEELDIQFLYIEGTPSREVLDIQNIWRFQRGNFGDILEDNRFEPRQFQLLPNGEMFKIRSTITGHAQNGEFTPRTHYINIDGGSKEFEYEVWKACGDIPIYPQGGTWLFDRSGWCPGTPTDVNEFDITDMVTPGGTVEIDYGLNGNLMTEANYLVSNQLVTYGSPNFTTDAALINIKRPSGQVEHERINPACNAPVITIRNNGMDELQSLTITYGVMGGEPTTYNWTGSLGFLEETDIELPIPDIFFWGAAADAGEGTLEVSISEPNGASDEYANNNRLTSDFELPEILSLPIRIQIRTNNRGNENSYTLKDREGNIIFSRNNMESATTYKDDVDLTPGCYTLELLDSGDDGLSYWFYDATNQNVGSGSFQIFLRPNPNLAVPYKTFESEFGTSIRYDFSMEDFPVSVEPEQPRLMSVYPSPTQGTFTLEMIGFTQSDLSWELTDVNGQLLMRQDINQAGGTEIREQIDIHRFPSGMYFIKIFDGVNTHVRPVILQK